MVQCTRDDAAPSGDAKRAAALAKARNHTRAWSLIERVVCSTRTKLEMYLLHGPTRFGAMRYRTEAAIEDLTILQVAMAKAMPFLLADNPRGRGARGRGVLPPTDIIAMIAADLRKAFDEAGHPKVLKGAIHRVLSEVFGNVTPDAIRKALPPGPRREKHQRWLKEQLGMATADLGETRKRGPKRGKK